MKKLLRYNSRHHLWFPRGYNGEWMPRLNPMGTSSHAPSGKRTFGFHEPRWLWQLRRRLFCYAGKADCQGSPATWGIGPDDNRTCSHCGSIHPDDLMTICRKTIVDERYAVEGTTKSYKVYVRQPGVRNASEGAIKFYMWHAPKEPREQDQQLFANAMRVTTERFQAAHPHLWPKGDAVAS